MSNQALILSLKFKYPLVIRLATLFSIILLILTFLIYPRYLGLIELEDVELQEIIIENIPQTQQIEKPPPPARPSVPVESEDEDIADDLTIEETDLDSFEAWDAPPPPPEGPRVKFIPYDDPPQPLSSIRPVYPEIAQEAGIEGTVVVQVFVDKKGRVQDTLILKGIPNTGLDEAAVTAIKKTRFRPAKQRERAVGVWISIPVNFRLK
ncbi:MAG: energy transducer TonB [Candidatus Neomarinimicrobiota bacterium]|jgi:protein TonB|nr:energy transducer TonB [Candidatus Neomarinimicrobiota bacterium]MAS78642.1 energy transducer TonB [Candidatus Neomarinimicrobiota bacterium]MEC7935151.1 energy transducer TonB [Candidatus Neomarinimicrobiota bacterium]MEC9007140.1 energy transducer TonB [Candidatus Neomarinimicrobiota bacterium]MEC9026959.1 energy transducer TonB [Candidatus Neomarinimicrobiota bacterium]|tara:strand:- start:2364 stop:2987 length:624 start_codon:yes stop_codon:yes gene_type:complete